MAQNAQLARYGGIIFAAGGAFTLVGSALHPTGGSSDYHASIAKQLAAPIGTPAAWLTLIGSLLIAWGVWVLLDSAWREGPPMVRIGGRLAVLGSAMLVVESAVALAMRTAASAYAAGTPVPMVRLSEALYAGCLPALMLGALMLNLGSPRLAPVFVRTIGAVGMVALGLAGPLVDGAHNIALWPLYLGGVLACIWIIWAGVRQATSVLEPAPMAATLVQEAGV
ncbi:MAG: hypothetical protein ACRDPB_04310 [Nocardioidaceae bacterium]